MTVPLSLHPARMKLRILALIICTAFALVSCSTRTAGRETAALSGDLATAEAANASAREDVTFLRANLSRADGKATVILRWLEQHRRPPEVERTDLHRTPADYLRPATEVRRAGWSTP